MNIRRDVIELGSACMNPWSQKEQKKIKPLSPSPTPRPPPQPPHTLQPTSSPPPPSTLSHFLHILTLPHVPSPIYPLTFSRFLPFPFLSPSPSLPVMYPCTTLQTHTNISIFTRFTMAFTTASPYSIIVPLWLSLHHTHLLLPPLQLVAITCSSTTATIGHHPLMRQSRSRQMSIVFNILFHIDSSPTHLHPWVSKWVSILPNL